MSDQVDVGTLLLAQILNEQIGDLGRRQFAQLRFLRKHVNFEFALADKNDVEGVQWKWIPTQDNSAPMIDLALPSGMRRQRYVVKEVTDTGREIRIGSLDESGESRFRPERPPGNKPLNLRSDKGALHRKMEAIKRWQQTRHPDREGFYRIFEAEQYVRWPIPETIEIDGWFFLQNSSRSGTDLQREFVRKALSTPDFAFLDGPPGSGKTTVLCELVAQLVSRGKKVLLCGQTHESVDNVLERLVDPVETSVRDLMPLRVASTFTRRRISPEASRYLRDEITRTISVKARSELESLSDPSFSQSLVLSALGKQDDSLQEFLIESANVMCGTTSGIVADPLLSSYFKSGEPIYDYLIVDEASKLTLSEFMVPALLARRWVLSGDPMQLPPHEDSDETASWISQAAGVDFEKCSKSQESAFKEIAASISRSFGLRFVDDYGRRIDPRSVIEDHKEQIPFETIDQFTDDVSRLIRLKMTSCLEQLIVRRRNDGLLHEDRFAGAVDIGLPTYALDSRMTRLEHQHRMHPQISRLVRDDVYQGLAMKDASEVEAERSWSYDRYPQRVVFVDTATQKRPEPSEQVNRLMRMSKQPELVDQQVREANAGVHELHEFVKWVDERDNSERIWEVGMLSFYSMGVEALKRASETFFGTPVVGDEVKLGASGRVEVKFCTVNAFQGREVDMTILHVGNKSLTAFTKSLNNANVALTRAKYQLVIIGNRASLGQRGSEKFLLGKVARDDRLNWGIVIGE